MKAIEPLKYDSTATLKSDVIGRPRSPYLPRGGRWHSHHSALLKVRERLLRHRAELAETITEPLEAFSLNMADAATDQFDHDLALSRLSAEQDVLYEVEAALDRIRCGTYGLCEATGQPIPVARLRAIPWARFLQEIEDELERQGVCRPAHIGELKSVHRMRLPNHASTVDEEEFV